MKPILPALISLLIAGALLSTAVAGPNAKPHPAAAKAVKTVQVSIDNFHFSPDTLTVPVGTRVTWVNGDDVPHTVVSTSNRFKSLALDTGDKFSHTFRTKGIYAYFCSVHPMMTARVIVR